jgi:hypothetical protein
MLSKAEEVVYCQKDGTAVLGSEFLATHDHNLILCYRHLQFTNWGHLAGHGNQAVACFLFTRSEAVTVGSNPTQGMDV